MEAAMKVSTSVWVAALASWICVGVAHAEGAVAVVATPAVVAVPVAAVAVAPVVVPTQEVAAEAALAEAPAAGLAPAIVAPAVAAPVVIPVLASPVVATTAEPAPTVSAVAPPPVLVPVAAPAAPAPAPAPAPRESLADPFATPAATPLWTTNGTQPAGVSTASTATTEPMPISPQSPYGPHNHPRRPEDYRLGVGMMFGGGITDFESPAVREMTGTGGAWDVRLVFGQREVLALETAYVGSAHYISAAGLDNDAMLVSNGAEGAPTRGRRSCGRGSLACRRRERIFRPWRPSGRR